MQRLAVIPARGASKRIPDKNILNFCGKPIISYSLSAARETKLFDVIHVSTESQKIIDVVENLGFAVDFPRAESLSDDYTPIMPVLKFATQSYQKLGKVFDQVWLIMACAPLINARDLLGAAKLFDKFHCKRPVIAVTSYPAPVEWAFEREENGSLKPVHAGAFAIRSQDLRIKYYDAGMFTIFPIEHVLSSEDAGDDSDFLGYVLPRYRAIDIDEPEDLVLAEALYFVCAGNLRGPKDDRS